MKEIVVISGKGGTGKTCITASFIHMAKNVVAADCDVDAANLSLLMSAKVIQKDIFYGMKKATINPLTCDSCGNCYSLCRFDSIIKQDNKFTVDLIKCEGCGVCVRHCPREAINFNTVESGQSFISEGKANKLVHARLNPGEGNSGKLVTLVKSKAYELAKEENAEYIVVDGPPGVGCPVIASIAGAKMVLVVTEPTCSGLSDLKRVLDLVKHFNISASVCINKSDINEDISQRIIQTCKDENILYLGSISYDENITKALLNGKSIVQYEPNSKSSNEIKQIWKNLNNERSVL